RWIERRVIAKRLRHHAELVRAGAVKLHMAARHQRVKCPRRSHAIGEPLPATAAAVGVARAAIPVPARATVVAVDERDNRGEAVADERGGSLDADTGETTLAGG